ncbi:MAG TPA: PfkB family carbohydrate kinase [Patescibacteria group bacterium]|nr:PfkB family carbohydrate kinase [Patescibacteria group bacterium]
MPAVVVVGCLTIDSVVTATGDLIRAACGGNALYAAAGAHVWDHRIGLVARAGDDYPAPCLDEIRDVFDGEGLCRLTGPHPLRVAFSYRADGSRTRKVPPAVLDALAEDARPDYLDNTHDTARYLAATPLSSEIPDAWLRDVDAVHLPALMAVSQRELVGALRAARPDRLITVDSPWYDAREVASDAHLDLLAMANVVIPSEDDLALFRPGLPLLDATRDLVDDGARAVVVKLGPWGSLVVDSTGQMSHVPAYPANTIDPTGAGDAFCGGLLVGLREGLGLVEAAVRGTISASFVVEERAALPIFRVERSAAEERVGWVADRVRVGITGDPRRAA